MYVEREPEDCGWRRRVGVEEKKPDLRLWVCRRVGLKICNSVSSLVGMVLFSSSCLVLVVGLEEKKLERQSVEP